MERTSATEPTVKFRLALFLFVLITLAAVLSGVGVGMDGRRALNEVMEREIIATQALTAQKVQAFDLFLSGLEGELDRELRSAVVEISERIGERDPRELSQRDLRGLIAPYNLSDIYLINRDKVVDNTTFAPDKGLDLGSLSEHLDTLLEGLYGSGRVEVDRISMSNQTGIIKKYAYYGPRDSDRLVEVSVNVREGFALIHSRAAQDFLFGVFFKSASQGDRVVEQDLFIADELAQWSLLRERTPMAEGIAERLREAGGRLELREGRHRLTIYQHHPIDDSRSGFHYISKTVYDTSLPDRFAKRSLERTLLVLALVVTATFLLASLLFKRWFTAPLDVIQRGLRRIEEGDYTTPIELPGRDELAHTAEVIDAMQRGILSRERQLTEARDGLERRVAERTAELSRSLDELERSETAYRYLVENANSAILRWTPDGRITFFNEYAQRFFGYDEEAILGASLFETIVPSTDAEGRDLHAMVREIGRSPDAFQLNENENLRRDGERVWMSWANRAVFDERGRLIEVLSIGSDATARKRAQDEVLRAKEAAEQANRAKSEFLATMSHEIRTPMNAVIGMADLLQEGERDEERRDYLEVLRRNGEVLLTLINDILDLSKVEAGRIELECIDFEPLPLVEEVVHGARLMAEDKGIELTARLDQAARGVRHGDVARLRQVLVNLLGNAVKFTREGSIEVAVEAGGEGRLRFSVRDSGIGIPEEKLATIFDPFTQADGSITRRYGGTGLGLAISRRLVELMGGTIAVESSPGEGSRFHFEVPLAAGEASLPEHPAPGAGLETRPLKLLLAEDTEDNVLLIRSYLKGSPHHLDVAGDGEQAVERFQRGGYDLVLMDVQMPRLDGLAATRAIRRWEQERGLPSTPILALTAHALHEDVERALEAGCNAHLSKPIKKRALLAAVADFADS